MRWSSLPPMSSSSNRGQAKCSSAIFDHRLLMPGSPHITGERERLIRPRCRCHGLQRAACGDGPGGKSASRGPMHNTDGPFSRPSADAGAEGHQVPAGAWWPAATRGHQRCWPPFWSFVHRERRAQPFQCRLHDEAASGHPGARGRH